MLISINFIAFLVYLVLNFGVGHSQLSGLFPDISFCDAEIGGFGQDVFYQNIEPSTLIDISIRSPGYPNDYTNGSCVCTLTTTADQDRMTVHVNFQAYELEQASCPSRMFIKMTHDRYYVCSRPGHPDGHTTHMKLRSGDTLKFYMINERHSDIRASIDVTGVIGEYMYLKCVAERVSHDKCKCSDDPPQYYISRDEDSDNTRVMFAFVGLIMFLLLLGGAILLWYCLRRRRLRNAKNEEATAAATPVVEQSRDSLVRNHHFFANTETPNNAHSIYAEINFGDGIVLSPNVAQQNGGRSLDGSRDNPLFHRGSVDSGLYSEMGERTNGAGTNTSLTTPRTSAYDMLQKISPDGHHEAPAMQSSPVLSPRSPAELERIYAKPSKVKRPTSKPKKPSLNSETSVEPTEYPPLPLRSIPQPNFRPDPPNDTHSGSRSGSVSSLSGQADLGQAVLHGSSLNELYVTDSQSTVNLNKSKGTTETFI